jgi:hypothetical protein
MVLASSPPFMVEELPVVDGLEELVEASVVTVGASERT